LETIRRLQLPIKFFVMNNDGYASIRASQRAYFGEAKLGCDGRSGLTIPSLTEVGRAFGLSSSEIENQANLREDVRRVLDMTGPVVCDVHVVPDEMRAPRLQSYQKADGSFVSKPLEDLFPFLPREEFMANMIVEPLSE
jgi:acetolactate synthase-1/2/3 large subunit